MSKENRGSVDACEHARKSELHSKSLSVTRSSREMLADVACHLQHASGVRKRCTCPASPLPQDGSSNRAKIGADTELHMAFDCTLAKKLVMPKRACRGRMSGCTYRPLPLRRILWYLMPSVRKMIKGCSARAQQAISCRYAWAFGLAANSRPADTSPSNHRVHLQLLKEKLRQHLAWPLKLQSLNNSR